MNRKFAANVALLVASVLVGGSLSACNTVKGAGQDMKSAGKAIEKKAENEKTY